MKEGGRRACFERWVCKLCATCRTGADAASAHLASLPTLSVSHDRQVQSRISSAHALWDLQSHHGEEWVPPAHCRLGLQLQRILRSEEVPFTQEIQEGQLHTHCSYRAGLGGVPRTWHTVVASGPGTRPASLRAGTEQHPFWAWLTTEASTPVTGPTPVPSGTKEDPVSTWHTLEATGPAPVPSGTKEDPASTWHTLEATGPAPVPSGTKEDPASTWHTTEATGPAPVRAGTKQGQVWTWHTLETSAPGRWPAPVRAGSKRDTVWTWHTKEASAPAIQGLPGQPKHRTGQGLSLAHNGSQYNGYRAYSGARWQQTGPGLQTHQVSLGLTGP
ncbi:hypothetical protein NDU88_007272 [Pleurodeles waltl]|uniref:Uncharacterized protein n=1 Tax=Pleurodeles waltl TaxID=8319 RepID=A0AAV7MHJ6_PLEWA|nr:hypothetical protein NDU88_007272 [Pleurodeles waltl]